MSDKMVWKDLTKNYKLIDHEKNRYDGNQPYKDPSKRVKIWANNGDIES